MRKIGIIGLPQAGKSSLFQVLTHQRVARARTARPEAHLGVVEVPDPRLARLAAIYNSERTVPAQMEFTDIHGNILEVARGGQQLKLLREVDGLAHVVRAFDNEGISHAAGGIDPRRDIENVELELMLSDLELIEKRLERVEHEQKKTRSEGLKKEQQVLKYLQKALEKQTPLREIELDKSSELITRGFMLLSAKPILFVINLGDGDTFSIDEAEARYGLDKMGHYTHSKVTAFCGKIESEIAELKEAEAAEFLADFGLKESGVIRIIRASYKLMGLISFLTAGKKEVRAWSIPGGTLAAKAAGVIHTDIEKGFIKAEIVQYEDLIAASNMAGARSRGTVKLEGKNYIVQDGDIVDFRHNR